MAKNIDWSEHLIGIRGSRGVGKTTMMLQHIRHNKWSSQVALYVSLDHMWFASHSILELVEYHYTHGGKYLFLDEIHRYRNWMQELKNISDYYPDMYVVFTGSSLLQIDNAIADLSRRCISYMMQGLSFREYLLFSNLVQWESFPLEQILNEHTSIAVRLNSELHVLPYFAQYLREGYYPFYWANKTTYQARLQHVISTIIDVDIPQAKPIEFETLYKAKQLLSALAGLVPYTLNISDLCKTIGITRNQLLRLLNLLERSSLIRKLYAEQSGIQSLGKPKKILFENTNLMYALSPSTDSGTIRETYFCNQLSLTHTLAMPNKGDIVVDNQFLFEVGGHGKGYKQIKGITNSWVVADDIETGFGNKIPLWLFGMMY
ncbi:MAG: ATP-binding protein [Paludibacteraceae bacterium]|nr:ATP-binding protein [Paludibacteraceae bacterium]